ncbi:hypothetical protein PGTUg99_037302 [Puccinia graminis f. sp. tritici]|uniref:C2H2-type domain-containing protein n=1 Tax=Puccinia graminis f. sp. tritici TaxID=56615 RepID=A0A5B0MHS5_PUCGR|nr:hypothetical protein PGTUg99_037302 [Puccinia graminis f. sp. tritici]
MNQYYQQQQQQQYYYYQQQQQQQYYQQQQQPQQSNSLISSVNQAIQNHLPNNYHHHHPQTQVQPQPFQFPPQQFQYQQPYYQYPYPPATTSQGYSISPTAHPAPPYQPYPPPNNRHQQNHHQNQNDNSSNKRPKTHHNQLEKFRCEECRQDYYNLMDLSNHLRNHIKCDYQDCKFEAIQNILDLHREDRHLIFKPGREPKKANPKPDGPLNATIQGLGYALKTQEEIDNWIQERKKKWPTKAVITQKKAHAVEKRQKILSELSNKHKNEHKNRRRVWVRNDQLDDPVSTVRRAGPSSTQPDHRQGESHQLDGNESSSSGSDLDPVKDAVSSKIIPPVTGPSFTQSSSSSNPGPNKNHQTSQRQDHPNRPHQKSSSSNRRNDNSSSAHLFLDRSGLFSKLIEKDVEQDVSDLYDVIGFLTRNSFLDGFHTQILHPTHTEPPIQEVLE